MVRVVGLLLPGFCGALFFFLFCNCNASRQGLDNRTTPAYSPWSPLSGARAGQGLFGQESPWRKLWIIKY
jgi:hypothetical protein